LPEPFRLAYASGRIQTAGAGVDINDNAKHDILDILEDDPLPNDAEGPIWRVLVVDDDPEVHRATRFALENVRIEGRPFGLLHAHSAFAARHLLETEQDIAVALLDVVMEGPDAGLSLIHTIRKTLRLEDIRIVLRTGQPGYAPELSVIRDYDINDYKTKSELTQSRLLSTLTIAIRGYRQIVELNRSHRGLDEIVRIGAALMREHDPLVLARQALENLPKALPCLTSAWIAIGEGSKDREGMDPEHIRIVATFGTAAPLEGQALSVLNDDPPLFRRLKLAQSSHGGIFDGPHAVFWLGDNHGFEVLLHCSSTAPLDAVGQRLLQVYGVNLGAGFQNAALFERLNQAAYYDALTGLFNRARFLREVDAMLGTVSFRELKLALLDVARFSELNDALGQKAGDALLIGIADRFRAHLPASIRMARVSGDAFGLCGPESELTATRIKALFDAPFYVRGHSVNVQVRVGLAGLFDMESGSELQAAQVLRNAGLALSQAKRDVGFHVSEYSGHLIETARNRVLMLSELRVALEQRQGLMLYYQPQVHVLEGVVFGAEALLRWRRDDGKMIPPDSFIPLAEYAGLIQELGHWALTEACRQIALWDTAGLPAMVLAVNVSAVQFRDEGFVDSVRGVLLASGVSPHRLVLEITESVAMEEISKVVMQLRELKSMGLSIALDDFGCGFSSLSSIHQLPFDKVKIDRGFVRALNRENAAESIAHTVTRLAAGLGIGVIAEGVEYEEQVQVLLEMECPVMQGYFFGQPMPADAFENWLTGGGLAAKLAPGSPQPGQPDTH
jgi:diguanylate cyclase